MPAGRMAIPLMRHQRLALAWMLHRERTAANPRGGILADDQGLGKTVSTIALIVTNQPGDDVADEGFEDLDSDEEGVTAVTADAAAANADGAIVADQDASATFDEHPAACSAIDAISTPAVAHDGCAIGASGSTLAAAHPADATDTSAVTASPARDDPQLAALSGKQPPASKALSQCTANSIQHTASNGAQNGIATHAAANGQGDLLLSPPPSQLPDVSNSAGLPEGGTLIVCPTAVLNQWARELEAKVAPPAGKNTHHATAFPLLLLTWVIWC